MIQEAQEALKENCGCPCVLGLLYSSIGRVPTKGGTQSLEVFYWFDNVRGICLVERP